MFSYCKWIELEQYLLQSYIIKTKIRCHNMYRVNSIVSNNIIIKLGQAIEQITYLV